MIPSSEGTHRERLLEWLFAGMMLLWGWRLVRYPEAFELDYYAPLRALAAPQVWGAWSMAIAALRIASLYVNGRWTRTPALRAACAMLGVLWWLCLLTLYWTGPVDNPPASIAWMPLFLCFEVASFCICMGDAFHARAFARLKRTA